MLGSQNSVRFSRMGTSFIIVVFTSAPRGLEVAAWVKDLSHFTFQKKKRSCCFDISPVSGSIYGHTTEVKFV